jgi:5'(3')-deoxyribonucleotidase
MRIFLDMDGVLADWPRHAMRAMNLSETQIEWHHANWSKKDVPEQIGVSNSYMWSVINRTPNFWETIPVYDFAHDFVKELRKRSEVIICTSPGTSLTAPSGKAVWLNNNKFKFGKNIVITPQKHLLANSQSILIDDTAKKVDEFLFAGGYASLFRRPWNSSVEHSEKAVEITLSEIDSILE